MIAAITPAITFSRCIPRKNILSCDLKAAASINIHEYRFASSTLRGIKFKILPDIYPTNVKVDLLWKLSRNFEQPMPGWSGMMHLIHNNQNNQKVEKSSVLFLPIIDMKPTEMTCILSTLTYLRDLALKHNIPTIITFDQPLFWKASQIVHSSCDGSALKGHHSIAWFLSYFHESSWGHWYTHGRIGP